MRRLALALLLMTAAAPHAAARPNLAAWTGVGQGRADCSSCHFDGETKRNDSALSLSGLPKRVVAGREYDLELVLASPGVVSAGFLIRAEGSGGGAFSSVDKRIDVEGAAARSATEGGEGENDVARWIFRWRAPASVEGAITFHVAANAGNDDMSPFGDQLYLSSFEVRP